MGVEQTMTVPTLRGIHSEVLAGDAAVSGGVLPSAVSGNEDAEFAQRVQETPLEMADRPRWRMMMMMMMMMVI